MQKSFAAHIADFYKGLLIPTDFSKPEEAVQQLNECVKRESSGKLDCVFKKQDVLGDPAMILLNVLFFKGEWQRPFEPHRTWRENFFTTAGKKDGKFQTVQVDMMNAEQSVPYYNDGVFHGIALAYKDRRFNMLVLTPVQKETPLSQLVRLLSEKGVEHFIQNSSRKNKTVIKLPKLKLSGDIDLKHLFSSLGMKTLFNAQHGDLTGIVQGKSLYISEARQILKLDLDEKGSEVAAVTYAVARMTSVGPQKEELNHFYADHPFILVLWDSETKAVLLTAAVIKP